MIVNRVYNWLQNNLRIEVHCLLCRGKALWKNPICEYCLKTCPTCDFACHQCGLPLHDEDASLCSRCTKKAPLFNQCLSGYLYEYPVRQIIQAIKYKNRLELISPITRQLSHTLQDFYLDTPWPEALIPIPLHNQRLQQRGYDQTLLLAKELHRQLPAEAITQLDVQLLQRIRATSPQQGLNAKARKKNIKHAFSLRSPISYHHIALIDDVVTTGETVSEATRLLKQAGIEKVDIWTLARTPEPDY
ncbi:hypothetical protein ACH42_08525 [Endozoicomonas sp. (ex Bugula neritina AB1)]|nr:hypothetical protein ACH42_08525 [Endozoicomonas sp. (ex Bugula neritina AB1)]